MNLFIFLVIENSRIRQNFAFRFLVWSEDLFGAFSRQLLDGSEGSGSLVLFSQKREKGTELIALSV